MTHYNLVAAHESLNAAKRAFDPSPLNMYEVARNVGRDQAERDRKAAAAAQQPEPATHKTPVLLGCWINGDLRFQSRDHDAIHDYADRHMAGAKNFGNNVWVAPVGSFVDAKTASQGDMKKVRKVVKANG